MASALQNRNRQAKFLTMAFADAAQELNDQAATNRPLFTRITTKRTKGGRGFQSAPPGRQVLNAPVAPQPEAQAEDPKQTTNICEFRE